jgi:hypothetical protein
VGNKKKNNIFDIDEFSCLKTAQKAPKPEGRECKKE